MQHVLHIQMHVPAAGLAERDIQLPTWNALYQIRDFSQNVRTFAATDAQRRPLHLRKLDKTTWRIEGAGDVEVDYDIIADQPGPYGAQFNGEHVFLNLAEVLAYPADGRQSQVTVTFTTIPAQWRIATTLPSAQSNASGTYKFVAENYDRLVDSPIEIGPFQQTSFQLDGATYRIVVEGRPDDFDTKELEETVKKIVATEIDWMKDRPFGEYLFIYHIAHGNASGGGMEHAYSCVIDLSAAHLVADRLTLPRITAHEFFHLWNVKRIRPASLEPVDYVHENYTRALWFSEGVTNTVQEIALLRAGILDEKEYLRALAHAIRNLQLRPAHRTQSAEDASVDAWLEKYPQYRNADRSISYYNKGEVLGVLLDLAVRQASHGQKSLREVFQWMNQHYAKQGRFFDDSEGVRAAVEAVAGADFSSFFHGYVSGVDELPYDQLFATVGLKLVQHRSLAPMAGFNSIVNSKRQSLVVAVDPESDAARAGLVPGDVILQLDDHAAPTDIESWMSGKHPGDTVKLKIENNKAVSDIKIKIGGREEDEVSIVETDVVTPEQIARRSAWLRGEAEQPRP